MVIQKTVPFAKKKSAQHGRLSKARALNRVPDPGASNSCMHTFPEIDDEFTMA